MTLQGLNSHKVIIGLNLVFDDPFLGAQALQFAIGVTWLLLSSMGTFEFESSFCQLVSNQQGFT